MAGGNQKEELLRNNKLAQASPCALRRAIGSSPGIRLIPLVMGSSCPVTFWTKGSYCLGVGHIMRAAFRQTECPSSAAAGSYLLRIYVCICAYMSVYMFGVFFSVVDFHPAYPERQTE